MLASPKNSEAKMGCHRSGATEQKGFLRATIAGSTRALRALSRGLKRLDAGSQECPGESRHR